MPMIDTGSTRLAYDEAGDGPAVVLLHAGAADRRMWDHQFAVLAADHEGPVEHHRDPLDP